VRKTDCKIPESDYMFGYRRFWNTMLRMAEEEYQSEKMEYGVERGTV